MNSRASVPSGNVVRGAVEDEIAALYLELHHKRIPSANLDARSHLDADLGFDSVARVELLQRLERVLQSPMSKETERLAGHQNFSGPSIA